MLNEFNEALKKLGIEEYAERIFNSNSHGELLHLADYVLIAGTFGDDEDLSWFPGWFAKVVKAAEDNWARPESIFQHIPRVLDQSLNYHKERMT